MSNALLTHDSSQFMGMGRRKLIWKDGNAYQLNAQGGFTKIKANEGLLRYDQWKDIDDTVVKVATDRLVGINDLRTGGLTHNLGGLGKTLSQWEAESDMTDATVSMSGVTEGQNDHLAYDLYSVPVPIIHKDFRLNIRNFDSSRSSGESLDVASAAVASRKVAELSEDLLFNGSTVKMNGATLPGLTNFAARNSVDFTDNLPWTDASKTGETILADVNAMITASEAAKYRGPFNLYVPTAYSAPLRADFKANSDKTVMERLLELDQISSIKVADRLTGDNVVMYQSTRDVIDLAMGQDITTVNWEEQGGMIQKFKVMAAWAPRLKQDYNGKSGITHLYQIT